MSESNAQIAKPTPSPADRVQSWWSANWKNLLLSLVGALVVTGAAYTGWQYAKPIKQQSNGGGSPSPQTEAAFLDGQDVSGFDSELLAEWRAVRGDHRMVAYAIAYCDSMRKLFRVDTMPRDAFGALLLDLTPSGDHRFVGAARLDAQRDAAAKAAAQQGQVPPRPDGNIEIPPAIAASIGISQKPIELTGYQQSILFLSDAIGRARLSAAAEAGTNKPDMKYFGWLSVVIGAVATLLVTIKASMSPPGEDKKGLRRLYLGVGLAAVILSGAGTALTSVKQFYDPNRSYRISKAALLELQKLHKRVAMEFVSSGAARCTDGNNGAIQSLKASSERLAFLQGWIVMASANLQDIDIAPLTGAANQPDTQTGKTGQNPKQEEHVDETSTKTSGVGN